ncbi:hypothetical protein V1525DRAFT_398134 [Lipomyces kononenkoae]|uniref:Uncharacterized protein n=1 Tax=Lipomyces kononenkoae TaxID=34357 RepID=A0ACC3T684_LIPKO
MISRNCNLSLIFIKFAFCFHDDGYSNSTSYAHRSVEKTILAQILQLHTDPSPSPCFNLCNLSNNCTAEVVRVPALSTSPKESKP